MDNLIQEIELHLKSKPENYKEQIKDLLRNYQRSGSRDYKKYKISNPHAYARNLIYMSTLFEAILLVWNNQASPIHSHNESDCWFVVLEGTLTEVLYSYTMDDGKVCLKEEQISNCSVGDCSAIPEGQVVHKIQSNGFLVTLHIYSRPIYKCNIYCPVTQKFIEKKAGFYTVFGRLHDADVQAYRRIYDKVEAGDYDDEGIIPQLLEMEKKNQEKAVEEEASTSSFLSQIDHSMDLKSSTNYL